jgi:hypothetical protein
MIHRQKTAYFIIILCSVVHYFVSIKSEEVFRQENGYPIRIAVDKTDRL